MKLTQIFALALPLAVAGFAQTSTQTTTEQRTESHSSRTVTNRSWKGMLVDANCSSAAAAPTGSADRATTPKKSNPDTSLNTNESANSTDRADSRSESSSSESHSEHTVSPEGTVTKRESHHESSQTTNSADRSTDGGAAGMSKWQSCSVTDSTASFGLVLNDGRLVKLDDAANAMPEFRNTSKFTRAEASGRPAHVTVRGVLDGETLKMESIR